MVIALAGRVSVELDVLTGRGQPHCLASGRLSASVYAVCRPEAVPVVAAFSASCSMKLTHVPRDRGECRVDGATVTRAGPCPLMSSAAPAATHTMEADSIPPTTRASLRSLGFPLGIPSLDRWRAVAQFWRVVCFPTKHRKKRTPTVQRSTEHCKRHLGLGRPRRPEATARAPGGTPQDILSLPSTSRTLTR